MSAPAPAHRPFVIASVMAAMFMVAIEATIVSTAMPLIVGQLGGLHLYSWVFSAFLLTQTATTVVFGKLSDIYGRKPILIFGIAVFLSGSILCGFAWSMPSMIVFRLIQGVGAGAIQPVAMTVVGDLYTARERGRVQGWLASVWGISAVIGPLAGGLIIAKLSWAWIFWINVPIGLAAAWGFTRFLHEPVRRERKPVDTIGAVLFAVAIAALMTALTSVGTSSWREASIAALAFAAAALLFVLQERRARDPMVALALWGRRPIAVANGAQLLAGMALIGLTTFLPMYVQGVLNRSPLVAGFALTVMVLGWPLGATLAARTYPTFGIRPVMLFGSALMPLGAIAFVMLDAQSSPVLAGAGSLVMGLGMGLLATSSIVLVQEIVTWSERGSATASNLFARNLGSTLGAAVLGSVLNYGLAHFGRESGAGLVDSDHLRALLDAGPGTLAEPAMRAVLDQSLHLSFCAVFALSVAVVLLSWLVPSVALERLREAPAE